MTRPKSFRLIGNVPEIRWFKPAGIKMFDLEEVSLTLDEIEALRLADLEGLYQEQVAERMQVSRQTVGRILTSARKKVSEALVMGKAIRLEGGQVQYTTPLGGCRHRGQKGDFAIRCCHLPDGQGHESDVERRHRVAITAVRPDLDSEVDLRFDQASFLLVVDLIDGSLTVLTAPCRGKGRGGKPIRNCQTIINAGVSALVTGESSQRAFRKLSAAGIKLYFVDGGTVSAVIERLKEDMAALMEAT
jgi:predicted DNA-binding protein (UPF0251 family)/predicted Fe-Mo cluster-binding NifX family protein